MNPCIPDHFVLHAGSPGLMALHMLRYLGRRVVPVKCRRTASRARYHGEHIRWQQS